jgi:ABC-type transport system involved in multi-copper enzyme maturation permease subunit
LLWKEIYHGIPAAPGPGMGGWQLPNRRQVLITLGCLAVLSWFLLCVRPTLWQILAGGLNQILRFVSVLFVGVWCWLLAFRAASCVSLERERRTLDGLLALPVDRAEILKAKWLGNVLRFRELAYLLLLMILVPGIAVGALHPAGVLLFMLAAGVHLAFFASLGLWLSLASRNTLWANMATAVILLLLFGGLRVGSAFTEISFRAAEGDWFLQVLHLAISPGRVWWFSLLSWTEFAAGEERWLGTLGQSLASLCLFAATAWLLWRLSCRQFRVQ